MERRPWIASAWVGAALCALVAWSAWQRWQVLAASPFPLGVDGYFYPLQLRSLLAGHGLAYPDFPLTFWLMAPFAALTDPIVGAKLAAAIYGALMAVPMYGVGRVLGGSRGAGLLAAMVAVTSAGSMFLTVEFVKNGIALTVAVAALWLVLRAAAAPGRARIGVALVGVTAALLSHKMAAGLVLGVGVPAVIGVAVERGALRGRRLLHALGALGALMVTGVGALAIGLAPSMRSLLAGAWTSAADWGAPALAFGRIRLMMGHEPALGAVIALLAAAGLSRRLRAWTGAQPLGLSPGARAAAWGILALALVTGLPWLATADPQGLGFRLRVAAFVPLALGAAVAVHALALVRAPAWLRAALPVVAAGLMFVATPADRTEGKIVAHPAMVASIMALAGEVPPGDVMIVPERHLMFMAAWYTHQPTRLAPGPVPPARRWRVMPLAFIGAGSPLDAALMTARHTPGVAPPLGLHPRHPNGLVLVREATWAWVLAQLPPAPRARFARWPTI